MSLKYLDMTNQEQRIWDAAFGAHLANHYNFIMHNPYRAEAASYSDSFKSVEGNGEIAWEVADSAVLAYRKWKQELIDIKDERIMP